ncbi:MAG: CBS domain-containing protein [Verrucomicrobiota bacterium]|nr:CBS domain-containing protein [Verrucomicrobiota bacterium]
MKIQEIMTPDARCIDPDATLAEVAQVMRELDVGAVPVCDHDRLAGILTDRDIVVRAVAGGRDPNRTTARETMTEGIVYAFDDEDVDEAARIMEENKIRRLPVLNRAKRLVGIISLGDLAMEAGPDLSGETLKEISESAAHSR